MLTKDGSLARQDRFRTKLEGQGIEAAVITDRREIYYLTGFLLCDYPNFPFPAMLYLETSGKSWLAAHTDEGEAVVDERVSYPPNVLYTMSPDPMALLNEVVSKTLKDVKSVARIGWQEEAMPKLLADTIDRAASPEEWVSVDNLIADLQRVKDPDEIELLKTAARAGLAAYSAAQKAIEPGVNELEVLSAGQLAARDAVGKNIFHGGDYQCGELGGWARDKTAEAGQLYIIDAHTAYHGYWSDLCRTWSVDANPTDFQVRVFDHIKGILEDIPSVVKPGGKGTELFAMIDARIRELPGFEDIGLIHHAGHAVGIRPHEMPDLNRDREGIFEVGNVFSCEPGAYNDELNCGLRLENTFHITESGVENLSEYPIEIIARK
jgi:Xaa-Pro aminopeptidase